MMREPRIIECFAKIHTEFNLGHDIISLEQCVQYAGYYIISLPPEINRVIYDQLPRDTIYKAFYNRCPNIFLECSGRILEKFKKEFMSTDDVESESCPLLDLIHEIANVKILKSQAYPINSLYRHPKIVAYILKQQSTRPCLSAVKRLMSSHVDNRDLNLLAVSKLGTYLKAVPENMKDDKEIVLNAVGKDGFALAFASKKLQDDEEVVFAAVNQHGQALEYASSRLRMVERIVLAAIQQAGKAIAFADYDFSDDKLHILRDVVLKCPSLLRFCPHSLKDDEHFVKACVTENAESFEYCSDRLKDNFEIVMLAVQQCSLCLRYASWRLQIDEDILSEAVKDSTTCLSVLPQTMKDNKQMMMTFVKLNPNAIIYASHRLKNDEDIVETAIKEGLPINTIC